MKKIYFKKISIKNFLSIGNTPLILSFNPGINIITGIDLDTTDANGVGKTTILNAVFFALFGETLNDLKKDEIVNLSNKKDCSVILDFFIDNNNIVDEYKITRGISPTKCLLFKNDVDITKSSIPKTNDYICFLLNASSTVFKHSVIMSINKATPFMALKKIERRKFIEGIMQLEVFGEMSLSTNKDYNDIKKDKEINLVRLEENQKNYKIYLEQFQRFEDIKKEKINDITQLITTINKEIETLKGSLIIIGFTELKEHKDSVQKLTDKEKLVNNALTKVREKSLSIDTIGLQRNIDHIKTLGDVCVECKKPYTIEDKNTNNNKIKEIQQELDKRHKEIEELNKKWDKLQLANEFLWSKIEIENKKIEQIEESITNNILINSKIEQLQKNVNQYQIELNKTQTEQNNFDQYVKSTQNIINEINLKIDQLKKNLNIVDIAKFILSEEGIKSNIIKQLLTFLNTKLNYYLKELGAPCTCAFDEYFEEKMLNKKNQPCSYFNFSDGETKRIDLSILFTFIDLRKLIGNNHINILMFDELLDSSLDSNGVDCVLKILKERVNKNSDSIYIITHKPGIKKDDINTHMIELVKKNGFTFLKEQLDGIKI